MLTPLDIHFSENQPTAKFTQEYIHKLLEDMKKHQFLWPEELKQHKGNSINWCSRE